MSAEEQLRLLELCMYALLPKEIYNHELSISTKNKFMGVIRNNLKDDTYSLKLKIVKCWNSLGDTQDNQMIIDDLLGGIKNE